MNELLQYDKNCIEPEVYVFLIFDMNSFYEDNEIAYADKINDVYTKQDLKQIFFN